jgi:COP9 signalosome complex subunit 5
MADTALKTFSLMNAISEISPQDAIYKFDPEENKRVLDAEPWKKE